MPPHLRPLLVAFVAAFFVPDGRAADKPPGKPDDARRAALLKAGYTAVPLIFDPQDLFFYVDGTAGTERVTFFLDSGQNATVLADKVAKKLKLQPGEAYRAMGADGLWTGRRVAVPGLTFGTFDTRTDYPAGVNAVAADGLRLGGSGRADGLIGGGLLDVYGAVVDYPGRTLYLRSPLKAAWPRLAGTWEVTSRQEDGGVPPPNPENARTFEFVGGRLKLTDRGGKTTEFVPHLANPREDGGYELGLLDPADEGKPFAGFDTAGLLKVDGGKLTVCWVADAEKAKGVLPTEFAAPKGSGYALLELKRTSPAPADPAPADPLRDLMAKEGYTAVPLERDVEGKRMAAARVGTEDLRLMVDTGANLSWFDAAGLKTWGAERVGAKSVEGLRAEFQAEQVHLRGLTIGGYDTRRAWRVQFAGGSDLSGLNTLLADQKRKPMHGMLGGFDLMNGSAVVDYHTDTLYLRPVKETVWPRLAGKWEGVAWEQDGREGRYAPGAAAVEFKDGNIRFTANGKTAEWGCHLRDDGYGYRVGLFDPGADVLADGFDYVGRGIFTLAGDTILLVMEKGRGKVNEDPTEFKVERGSGLLTVEYRRAK